MMRWLNRSILESPVFWGLCTTQKRFDKMLKSIGVPKTNYLLEGSNATTHTMVSRRGHKACVIALGPTKGFTKIQVRAILVHEVVHVWQTIREALAEEAPSSEMEAYAIQALTQRVFEEYERQVSQPARKGKHKEK